VRSATIVFLAAACGGHAAPTDKWCDRYVSDLNGQMRPLIAQLADAKPIVRQNAATELRLVVHSPEEVLASTVCGDARGDSAAELDGRQRRVARLHAELVQTMLKDLGNLETTAVSAPDVADLEHRFDALTQALMAGPAK
jgi:hypothetical protein